MNNKNSLFLSYRKAHRRDGLYIIPGFLLSFFYEKEGKLPTGIKL